MADDSPNVRLTLLFTFLQSFGRGIWLGNVLSAFIFFLAGESHSLLGWVSSATGLAMTLVVFPAGTIADKVRRDLVLKGAFLVGLVALSLMSIASTIFLVVLALIFWGMFQGMVQPSLEAIFADSLPSGGRSAKYAQKHLLQQLGMAIGPIVNIVLFMILGDEWDLTILRKVMLVGLAISAVSLFPLLRFDDRKAIGKASEAFTETESGGSRSRKVPYIVVASNLIIGVGAGMTIRYFPIFFYEVYDLAPVVVNEIMAGLFILTGTFGLLAQRLSLERGRPLMIFIVQMLAIACLFGISMYPPFPVLVVLFLLRGSLMNASQPLSRSILMDYIPKTQRGRWNSVQAIAWGLFWNFSAVIGGYLIEGFGYSTTFVITASVYTLGTLPFLFLIPLVRGEDIPKVKMAPPLLPTLYRKR